MGTYGAWDVWTETQEDLAGGSRPPVEARHARVAARNPPCGKERPFTSEESAFVPGKRIGASASPMDCEGGNLLMPTGYKSTGNIVAVAITFAISVLAAHRLTRSSFGEFAWASALGWVLAVICDGGVQFHVARELARDPAQAARTIRRWLRLRVTITTTAAVVVVAAAAAGAFGSQGFALAVIVIAYLLGGLVQFFQYVYRGLARADLESSLVRTHWLLTLGAAGAVLAWMPRLDLLALALLLPAMLAVGLSRGISAQSTVIASPARHDEAADAHPGSASPFAPCLPPDASLRREVVRGVLPLGAAVVFSAIYYRFDVFLIQFWNGPERVALYSAAFTLSEALRLLPAAMLVGAVPALCRAPDIRPLIRLSGWVVAFALFVSVPLVAASSSLVAFVYGRQYADAAPAFRVLLLSFPLLSLNVVLMHQLVAWNTTGAFAATCAVALLANVLLNAMLIPAQGIVGAAWAVLGTEIVLTTGCAIALARARQTGAPRFAIGAPVALAREGE